jgi:NAD(P)H-dependent FMN reductase
MNVFLYGQIRQRSICRICIEYIGKDIAKGTGCVYVAIAGSNALASFAMIAAAKVLTHPEA